MSIRHDFHSPVCRPSNTTPLPGTLAALNPNLVPTQRLIINSVSGQSDSAIRERTIGKYELVSLLGEGGMGAVYLAQQNEPEKRQVAVKLVRTGYIDAETLARFDAERQALALMDHPNIAKILDGGTTKDGTPYFVMEYVDGIPLTEYCDRQRLSIRDRLDLFLAVCSAVQHAHQKGIIHRDLKPGNILVEMVDGHAIPKVIDFGLVKALHAPSMAKPDVTRVGQVMGTPVYMAPEQADGGRTDADTRVDVYALGVILYELLTGTTPLPWAELKDITLTEQLRLVREAEPAKPSDCITGLRTLPEQIAARGGNRLRLRELVRGDLDWIVTKALEKDRERRYESAAAFAEDIRRHLIHEPVSAGPPSRMYRARKFMRRNRGLVVTTSLVAATLVVGVIATSWAMARAWKAEGIANRERDQADVARELAREGERKARESDAESRTVIAFFQDRVLSAARPKWHLGGLGKDATIRDALSTAEPLIATTFASQPRAEAAIRDVIGKTYRVYGDYGQSLPQHERAVKLFESTVGTDHPDTWTAMNNLGVAMIESSRPKEALPLIEKVVEARLAHFGPRHEDLLDARNNLASVLRSLGKTERALELFTSLEVDSRDILGSEHPRTLLAMGNRAAVMQNLKRFDDALALMKRTQELELKVYGKDHPQTISTGQSIGMTYMGKKQFAESIPYFERAVAGNLNVFGDDHHQTMLSRDYLVESLIQLNRHAEAAPHCNKLFWHRVTQEGAGASESARVALRAASCDLAAGHPAEAAIMLETVLRAWQDRPNPDGQKKWQGMVHGNLGFAYHAMNRPLQEARNWKESIEHLDQYEPDRLPERTARRANYGRALLAGRQFEKAADVLEDVFEVRYSNKIRDLETARVGHDLAKACTECGRYATAEKYYFTWIDTLRQGIEGGDPNARGEMNAAIGELVRLYGRWNKPEKAAEWQAKPRPREQLVKPAATRN